MSDEMMSPTELVGWIVIVLSAIFACSMLAGYIILGGMGMILGAVFGSCLGVIIGAGMKAYYFKKARRQIYDEA